MALGFGKKKGDPAAEAAPVPQNEAPAAEAADFDADTFALDQFAADLESAGSSAGFSTEFGQESSPAAPPGNTAGEDLAWDDTALLNFDPGSVDTSGPEGHVRAGARGGEATPFDDLARELEDIPSIATDDFGLGPVDAGAVAAAGVAGSEIPERKTHRKAVSADLKEAMAGEAPQKGAKKPKKEKPIKLASPDGKKKPPVAILAGLAAVLLLGGGAAFMFIGGGNAETEDLGVPPEPAPALEGEAPAPDDGAPAPASDRPADLVTPAGAPPKPAGAKPALDQAKLKSLWEKGKAAKHAKKYDEARAAWSEILKLDPGHAGIQEAIDKLPKKKP